MNMGHKAQKMDEIISFVQTVQDLVPQIQIQSIVITTSIIMTNTRRFSL